MANEFFEPTRTQLDLCASVCAREKSVHNVEHRTCWGLALLQMHFHLLWNLSNYYLPHMENWFVRLYATMSFSIFPIFPNYMRLVLTKWFVSFSWKCCRICICRLFICEPTSEYDFGFQDHHYWILFNAYVHYLNANLLFEFDIQSKKKNVVPFLFISFLRIPLIEHFY